MMINYQSFLIPARIPIAFRSVLCVLAILMVLFGCRTPRKEYKLDLILSVTDSIPSGSGIAILQDSAFIIGDDSPDIYKLSLENGKFRKIHIPGSPLEYRIPKPVKQDFESALITRYGDTNWLLAFGSGTLAPFRDSLLMMNVDNGMITTFSLANLYGWLVQIYHLRKESLNIEAATVVGDNLFLFNRGTNSMFKMPVNNLFEYVNGKQGPQMSGCSHYKIDLPSLNGIPALISGAATLSEHQIIFTASLENTKDWTKDGEIFGSYIGILDVSDKEPKLETCLRLSREKEPLIVKLESLDIVSQSNKKVDIMSVADNDDGSTTIYMLELNIK